MGLIHSRSALSHLKPLLKLIRHLTQSLKSVFNIFKLFTLFYRYSYYFTINHILLQRFISSRAISNKNLVSIFAYIIKHLLFICSSNPSRRIPIFYWEINFVWCSSVMRYVDTSYLNFLPEPISLACNKIARILRVQTFSLCNYSSHTNSYIFIIVSLPINIWLYGNNTITWSSKETESSGLAPKLTCE